MNIRTRRDQAVWIRAFMAAIGPAMSHHLKDRMPGQGGNDGAVAAAGVLASWAAEEAVRCFNDRFPHEYPNDEY